MLAGDIYLFIYRYVLIYFKCKEWSYYFLKLLNPLFIGSENTGLGENIKKKVIATKSK